MFCAALQWNLDELGASHSLLYDLGFPQGVLCMLRWHCCCFPCRSVRHMYGINNMWQCGGKPLFFPFPFVLKPRGRPKGEGGSPGRLCVAIGGLQGEDKMFRRRRRSFHLSSRMGLTRWDTKTGTVDFIPNMKTVMCEICECKECKCVTGAL